MDKILKTGYEWCLDAKIRLLIISQWETDWLSSEDSYFREKIDVQEFYKRLEKCNVVTNSTPRKTEMYLEYRMYGLVPYNLSPIQQGIQFGHAVVEYGRLINQIEPFSKIYNKWADEDKTFIILNGGTTNNNPKKLGTLNKHMQNMLDNNVSVRPFYEPDLGDQLTAFVFLVDERVFNRTLYPDFVLETLPTIKASEKVLSQLEEKNKTNYKKWEEKIGGPVNAFLRDYLKQFKLA